MISFTSAKRSMSVRKMLSLTMLLKSPPGGLADGEQVGEDALNLDVEVVFEFAGGRVYRDLPGEEDEVAGAYGL